MAFVNESLTPEQRADFRAKGIKNPVPNSWSQSGNNLEPLFRTIDKERDLCLVHAGVYRDAPQEHYFVFLCNGECHTLSFIMDFTSENTVVWKNERDMSEYVFIGHESYANDLKEALTVYKYNGQPDPFNETAGVDIRF